MAYTEIIPRLNYLDSEHNILFICVLAIFLIFSIARYFAPKLVNEIFQDVFFIKTIIKNEREQRLKIRAEDVLLFFSASAGIALNFIVFFSPKNNYLLGDPFFIVLFFSLPLFIFIIQAVLLFFLSLLLPFDFGISRYLEATSNLFIVLGLFMAPIALFSLTGNFVLQKFGSYLAIFLICALIIVRWIRGFTYCRNKGSGFIEILLYLCTLELIPFFLVLKLIKIL